MIGNTLLIPVVHFVWPHEPLMSSKSERHRGQPDLAIQSPIELSKSLHKPIGDKADQ